MSVRKIGIDIQSTRGLLTGIGTYTQCLVQGLLEEGKERFDFVLFSKEQKENLNTFNRILWESRELPKRVKQERADVLHVPAFSPPMNKPCKTVVTVHDLIGMVFPNQMGWPSRFYWGKWLPSAVKGVDALIADSENTKMDIVRHLGFPESKITVIYPSGHEGFSQMYNLQAHKSLCGRLGIQEKYLLAVGTLEPRKNIFRLIEAFLKFRSSDKKKSYQLVIIGSIDFAHGKFLKQLRSKYPDLGKDVLFPGYISREDLKLLYAGSSAFLFPSLYEGFGIPVLEAMASGTPVLTSHLSSLPEVAGEAALYVDAYNVNAIAEGIQRIIEDQPLRNDLIQKGLQQVKRFSWRETARKTLRVYENIINGRVA